VVAVAVGGYEVPVCVAVPPWYSDVEVDDSLGDGVALGRPCRPCRARDRGGTRRPARAARARREVPSMTDGRFLRIRTPRRSLGGGMTAPRRNCARQVIAGRNRPSGTGPKMLRPPCVNETIAFRAPGSALTMVASSKSAAQSGRCGSPRRSTRTTTPGLHSKDGIAMRLSRATSGGRAEAPRRGR
jgi:hypothetical protein